MDEMPLKVIHRPERLWSPRELQEQGMHLVGVPELDPKDAPYDPYLERLDVAVKAVWIDLSRRHGALLSEAGVDVEPLLHVSLGHHPRHELGVFEFLQRSPLVLPAALELVRLYIARNADGRFVYYAVLRGEPYYAKNLADEGATNAKPE